MSHDIAPATTSDDVSPGEPVTAPRGPVTSASYSITVRLTSDGDPASIGRIATAVGSAGGAVTAIDVVDSRPDGLTVDVTCSAGRRRTSTPRSASSAPGSRRGLRAISPDPQAEAAPQR